MFALMTDLAATLGRLASAGIEAVGADPSGPESIYGTRLDGDVCIAVGPSADFRMAQELARETAPDVEIRYVIPREGATLWIDTLAIPSDAPHPENAHLLIDYLMRPDVIAAVTRAIYFPNANRTGTARLPAAIRGDPMIYPDAAAMSRLHMNEALSDAHTRAQNREFARFKSAR